MHKFTLTDRLRYQFDNTLSRGTIALIGWLGVLTTIVIAIIALVAIITRAAPEEGSPPAFFTLLWMGLMRTLDPGTMGGDAGNPQYLALMLTFTMAGIFLVSTLIGIVTSGIDTKIEQLRKGRSFVVETDHTVILGWSNQIFSIISELVQANSSRKSSCIVVLASKDKVEMEDEIRDKVEQFGKTRIVCRTGNPADPRDLEIVNPGGARSIIILAPEEGNPDSQVIKTILALTNNPKRRPEPYHIVAEISDSRNLDVAHMISRGETKLVLVSDLIARITVQVCRQAGLSVVYTELLDFGGDEIYFKHEPSLVGKTFGEALFAFADSALIGIKRPDGMPQLNPGMDTPIADGDQLIAIAEDDTTLKVSGQSSVLIDAAAIRTIVHPKADPERTLLLGWNDRALTIIEELNEYIAPGSELLVVASDEGLATQIEGLGSRLKKLRAAFQLGDTTDRIVLDMLDVGSYHHVIVLADTGLETQEADARTLITLLHLRDMEQQHGYKGSIVSEMLDLRNRELAEVTQADDFIVSDRLVSLLVTQIAENKDLAEVFEDLFDADGSELYLKPAADYVISGKAVTFYTVLEAARRRSEIAIGYRLDAESSNPAKSYGVYINPDKARMLSFGERDKIIVLAEG